METGRGLHVVFGAGQVGLELARRLSSAGHPVRLVRRSGHAVDLPGVELARADATDPAAAAEAAAGAAVVYHCLNAAYSTAAWAADLPRLQAALVAAAGRAGARLVVLDNLYALGKPKGRTLTEELPLAPCSRKGEIRARLHEALEAAVARGDVQAVTGRASDFYGPGGLMTQFGDRFWRPALAGRSIGGLVDPATPHTYHFIPDVAAGLAALGLDASAGGTFMLPCHPAESTRALVERLAAALGRPIALGRIPPLLLRLLSFRMPILKELEEMSYQWAERFEVSDARFRARFGDLTVPREAAARATVAWARAAFGPGAA